MYIARSLISGKFLGGGADFGPYLVYGWWVVVYLGGGRAKQRSPLLEKLLELHIEAAK